MPLASYFMLKNDKVDSVKYFFFVYFLYIGPFQVYKEKFLYSDFFLLLITIDSFIIITNNIIQYLTPNS